MRSTRRSVSVTRLGAGAAIALAPGERGEVMASFRHTAYLRMGRGLVALTPPGTQLGPVHAMLAEPVPPLRIGTTVQAGTTIVVLGDSVEADLSMAVPWTGEQPEPSALWAGRHAASRAVAPVAARSALLSEPYASASGAWWETLPGGDIEGTARRLAGLGPGFTPSGDDALAGVLLVARLLWGAPAELSLLGCLRAIRTSEPSMAFLTWAARGQSLAPAHDLLSAAAEGRGVDADRGAAVLARVGATSGADLCLGMQRALDSLRPAPGSRPAGGRAALASAAPG